jgi:hypothetical protein
VPGQDDMLKSMILVKDSCVIFINCCSAKHISCVALFEICIFVVCQKSNCTKRWRLSVLKSLIKLKICCFELILLLIINENDEIVQAHQHKTIDYLLLDDAFHGSQFSILAIISQIAWGTVQNNDILGW